MNGKHAGLGPQFSEACSPPTTHYPHLWTATAWDTAVKIPAQRHDHLDNRELSCGGPAECSKDTNYTTLKARSQRFSPSSTAASFENGSVQSYDCSRRTSTTTQNEDRRNSIDCDRWPRPTDLLAPDSEPQGRCEHRKGRKENDQKTKREGDMEEKEDNRETENKQNLGKGQISEDEREVKVAQSGKFDTKIGNGKGDLQIESPEADSQPLTPKPEFHPELDLELAELSQSEPPSPRAHIHAMQDQSTSDIPNIQPLKGAIQTFLDDWSDDEADSVQLERERKKLKASRVELVRFRSYLRAKYEELKKKESAKIAADETFMEFVRANIAKPLMLLEDPLQNSATLSGDLDHHFQAMQTARDEYGPLEAEYSELRVRLDDMEYELARTEGRVYSRRAPKHTPPHSVTTSGYSPSNLESGFGGSWSDEQLFEPLHFEYLSRLGDLDLALERLAYMNHEFDALTDEKESKSRDGIEFDPDLETFLDELPAKQDALNSEIANIQFEVDQLRTQCLDAGIELEPAEDESVVGNSAIQASGENGTVNYGSILSHEIHRPHIHGSHCMFIPLFPFKDTKELCSFQHLITKFDENNKSDRINGWLLYSLRASKLDASRFAQYCLDFVGVAIFNHYQTGSAQWILQFETLVISTWLNDGTKKSPEAFKDMLSESFGP